jgi:predicted permease
MGASLVVGQLALAILLLTGAGLLLRSFWNLLDVDPGFQTGGVLKAEYQLPRTRYPANFATWPDFREQHAFVDAILARAAALPGVDAAAVAGQHPLDPGFTNSFVIVGREDEARAAGWPELSVRRVTPAYFRTVGLQVARGRAFEPGDGTRAPRVALVNEAAAARFFAGRDPVGAQLRLYGAAWTIVGVVGNERTRGLADAAPLSLYLPLAQAPSVDGAGVLLVRTRQDPASLAGAVRGLIRDRDPALAVFGVEPLDQTLTRSVADRAFAALLVALFAALALLLAAVGVYGMLAFEVARRGREIGIRIALGAERREILRLVLGRALTLITVALVIGIAAALMFSRVLTSLLFGVTPHDPATLAAAGGALTLIALAGAALPAWRAARLDPAAALRKL